MHEWPKINDYIPLRQKLQRLKEIHDGCEALAKREGDCHAEWHTYEMACDNFRDQFVQSLYDVGFIRVGILQDEIAFEGTNQHLINHSDRIRRLASQICSETGRNLKTNLHPRESEIKGYSVEEERSRVTRDSIQEAQNQIRKNKACSANLFAAMVPEFVTTEGKLTPAGQKIINIWKAEKAKTTENIQT